MGYRGFLKPKAIPASLIRRMRAVVTELWASKTVGSRVVIGLVLGLVLGGSANLVALWACKSPSELLSRPSIFHFFSALWETLASSVLLLWGESPPNQERCTAGELCLMVATNAVLFGLLGALIGWYVGRFGKLRRWTVAPAEGGGANDSPIPVYRETIWRQAQWGFWVGLALSGGAFALLLLHDHASGGEQRAAYWWLLLRPSLAVGLGPPESAGYGSLMFAALGSGVLYGALLGLLCAAVAALAGPPRRPKEQEYL